MNNTSGIWAVCKERVAAIWERGLKGRGICIAGAILLSMWMPSACRGEGGSLAGDSGGNWKYTGEYFSSVFDDFPKDEGVIYQHYPQPVIFWGEILAPITVVQSTKKGNLVQIEDSTRVVWVETKRRYEDGERLDQGYYIRRGLMEYTTAFGVEKTVARYVEVTDQKVLLEIAKAKQELEVKKKAEEEAREAKRQAEEKAREAKRQAEEEAKKKVREEAAEQGTYELDIPIKSLCGFKLGAPPSQVQNLLLNDDGTPVVDLYELGGSSSCQYQLAIPFRLFTRAEVAFMDHGVGKHLQWVTLNVPLEENVSRDSYKEEANTLSELIMKKFGITLVWDGSLSKYYWHGKNESIEIGFEGRAWEGCSVLYLKIEVSWGEMYRLDTDAIKARKTNIQIDNDVGFDNL